MKIKPLLPGLLLSAVVAVAAFYLHPFVPGVGAIVLGLIIGVVLGNVVKWPEKFNKGIKFSSGKVLEAAIVLMAFEVNLLELSKVGLPIIAIVLLAVGTILFTTIQLSKRMQCPGANGWLIGFGTAICGSAAISAIGPLITKDKTQIGISLAVINILGGIGIFALPALVAVLNMGATESGILMGGTLHSMGHVAGASVIMDEEVRNVAISVKLARIALLTPALLVFSHFVNASQSTEKVKFSFKLPVYLVLFVLISIGVSFLNVPDVVLSNAKSLSAILLTVAMVAIGIKISFRQIVSSGGKAVLFGIILFTIFLLVVLGLIAVFI